MILAKSLKLEDYKVGWITALPIEAAAAKTMLDEIHPSLQTPYHDSNVYTFGQANTTDQAGAGTHNVVIASGRPGKANAATVANDMRRTFPWLRIGLMVGIAGGVWSPETDVRLGDVVVGIHPTGEAGIIQYDYGKSIQDKAFVKTGAMNKAPGILLNAVAAVQAEHLFHDLPDTKYISNLGREYAKKFAKRPAEDRLFHASYTHQTGSCEQCDRKQLRDRPQRDDSLLPRVHYGAIASGDRVVRDAVFAEETRKAYGVLCFEMEAAGLDGFPSLTIRGVSDYCDTHKNDDWHQYAAVSAAAYARELLNVIAPTAVSHLPTIGNVHWIMPRRSNLLFTGREDVLQRLKHQLIPGSSEKQPISVFQGIGGSGKSEMAIRFAEENKQSFWGIFWIDVSSQVMAEQSFADLAQAVGLSNTTVQHVVHWLSNISRPWLLVLDNCDDKEINVSKFIPSSGGSIIITTRLAGFQGTLEVLDTLNHGDAIELLRKACILDVEEQEAYTHDADAVVELLGCHALALVHAGAYIRQGYCSLARYPQLFRQQRQRLMHFKPGHRIPGHDSVYTTFEISAQYLVSSEDPVDHEALGLLSVLAFLEGSNIREDIIIKALESGQTPDTPTETSNRPFEGAPWTFRSNDFPCFNRNDIDIAALELYQIPWTWDNDGPNKITVLRQIDQQDIRALSKVATRPSRMPAYPRINTKFLDIETLTSFHLSWEYDPNDDNYIVILREMEHHEVNLVFEHTKRRRERMRFLNPVLQTAYEQQSDHASDDLRESIGRDVNLSVRNWLAEAGSDTDLDVLRQVPQQFSKAMEAKEPLRHLSREAKTLLELVLKYRSEFFTPASKEVLVPLVTLAKMHLSDGDHQRVISILEPITWPNANNYESHDADHRDSAYTLALAYLRTNQYKLARPLLEEVVNAEKHMFLPNDSTRLSRMDTLAQVYVALEEEYRAKPLLDEIASIRAQMRDPDPESPYRLMGMHNLVATYVSFGLFESAANVLEDIVRVTTRTLYPSHRTRLENMAQLASVLLKIDSNDRVLELLEEVLKLGATINLQNYRVVADLAKAYIRVGKSDKALKLLKKTLENPVTHSIDDLNHDIWRTLAEAYGASGQYTKAISTSQKILETLRNSKDPSLVEFTKVDLATAFMNSNDMERAIDLLEDTRAKIDQRSSQAMELLSSKLSLAYMRVGLYAKAVPILEHLVHEMHGRKRPVDSELILEECKLAKSYFQIMNTDKAINVLDEGIQSQALAYPFDYRIRFQSINKQIRSRLVLETPTAMFEATVLLEAEIQLEGRFVELDCKTLSGSRLKLLDIYKQTSELEKIHAHLEKVLFQRNKSLGTNAKANFLVNWFAISQNYLDDDKCISMLEEVTQKELESSDENELNCLQHTLVEIYSKISSEKAIPLLEAIVERESSLEGRDRLNCMEQLATAYADSEQHAKVIDASRVLIDALKAFPFEDPQRWRALRSSAAAYLRLDQPTRAAQLLEEVVIIEARLLPEDHPWRLLSMRMLAQAYMGLEKIRKLEDAVSLLQKVMQRGRETLHTDPQELAITEAMLADARDMLAKILELQSRDQMLASASAVMRWACREITSRAAIMF
ncbi:TPR-like protein [Aureobasidium pullulans]|nr:TPR-like protein [Aureobasidium pullulans]